MSSAMQALGRVLATQPQWRLDHGSLRADVEVMSRPDTVVWGHVPVDRAPVATIGPGARARVHTVSHQGLVNGRHPIDFFGGMGVPAADVLNDVVAIYEQVHRPSGAAGHVLTGPIAVSGARIGDALEIRLLAAEPRVPYGVNRGAPGVGVLPELLTHVTERLLVLDRETGRFCFAHGIGIPAAPFPGVVSVTPRREEDGWCSRRPGAWGGNLDLKSLVPGARLLLPVFQPAAGLYLGDPHGAQGDGEVNGTAIEQSATFTIETVIHPGLAPAWPVVLTPDRIVCTGIDVDLRCALEVAVQAMVEFTVGWAGESLGVADAYALCSIAADVGIAEAVNGAHVAYASLPTSVFSDASD